MLKNRGKELEKKIKAIGSSKAFVARLIKISRPTLLKRIKDGNFTAEQIEVLINNKFIKK